MQRRGGRAWLEMIRHKAGCFRIDCLELLADFESNIAEAYARSCQTTSPNLSGAAGGSNA